MKKSFAQNAEANYVSIDSISEHQVLDKGWKFQSGDNSEWARKDFNDSAWEKITKQKYAGMVQVPDDFKNVGWLRIHLLVDSSVIGKPLIIGMIPVGAADVYLDGQLLKKFGSLDPTEKKVVKFGSSDDVASFNFNNEKEHVVAVRYLNSKKAAKKSGILKGLVPTGFNCFIGDYESYNNGKFKSYAMISSIIGFFTGFFAGLFALHLLLYLFYRKNRSNLYYSIYSFCLFLFCYLIGSSIRQSSMSPVIAELINIFLPPVLFLSLLGFLHTQFYEKIPKTFHVAVGLSLLAILFHFIWKELATWITVLLFFFAIVEAIRVVIVALRRKKDGAKIIGAGVLIAIVFPIICLIIIVVMFEGTFNSDSANSASSQVIVNILIVMLWSSILSISLSMSIYLARQFAQTNKGLEKQIIQVKELSGKMIEAEKEKKKMLESQNEQLEIQVAERTSEVVKQKEEIEEKSAKLAEAYKDMRDSIRYAKRIQESILPSDEAISEAFPNSFVLYQPKDIVSGDFYWLYSNTTTGRKKVFVAAADCTGHGVPGAFMSTIGCENLNEAVQKSDNAGTILQLTNRGMKKMLHQSGSDESTRDGMDVALISMEFGAGSSEHTMLNYAGANRPLWIIRNNSAVLEEIKATKVAIGGLTENEQQFETHSIQLNKGDTIYIASDGYADQFSPSDKKLMTKRFKEILISIQEKTMREQKEHLQSFIEKWRGNVEQVDDILVIGVRV